jgi:hypothetical protein
MNSNSPSTSPSTSCSNSPMSTNSKKRKHESDEEDMEKSPTKRVSTLLRKAIRTTTTAAGGSKTYKSLIEEASKLASEHGRAVIRRAMLCYKSSRSRPSKSILEAYIKGSSLVRRVSHDMTQEEIDVRRSALKMQLSIRSVRTKVNSSCKICKKSFSDDKKVIVSCSRCDAQRHENCIPKKERAIPGFMSWHCEKCTIWKLPDTISATKLSNIDRNIDRNTFVTVEL